MSQRDWGIPYHSYAAFYEDVYGSCIVEQHEVSRAGVGLLLTHQSAGDWSDAPSPDLVIQLNGAGAVPVSMDLGASRFSGTMPGASFVVVAPGSGTNIVVDAANSCNVIAIPYTRLLSLGGDDAANPLPSDGDFGPLHAGFQRDEKVLSLLNALWRDARNGSVYGTLAADGLILQAAAALLALRDASPHGPARGGLAPWQVRRVTEYLCAHLDTDLSLADLADLVDLSAFHFCRAFKIATGTSPHAWLAERRIERAQDMMAADPSAGLTAIALAVGYGSQSAFGTAFRRATGSAPSVWRKGRVI